MKYNIWKEIAKFVKEHKLQKRWRRVLVCLAAVVVFVTVYALILPAITLEATCGMEEHTHTDECYEITVNTVKTLECGVEIHSHTAECTDEAGNNICGKADFVVHTHDENCFNGETLVCTLPEKVAHTHSEECTTDGEGTACTLEEIIVHTHDETCYDETGALSCGKLEVAEHVHSDACFKVENGTEEKVLKCEATEHTHNDDCYPKIVNKVDSLAGASEGTISGTVDNITWTLTPIDMSTETEYTLTISGDGAVPENFCQNEEFVNTIDEFGCEITDLIIAEGIDSIGASAFAEFPIKNEISIASTVTEIGYRAFGHTYDYVQYGEKAFKLTFEKGENGSQLKVIGENAFEFNHFKEIVIPSSVTEIGDYAFWASEYVGNIVFEEREENGKLVSDLTTIGAHAFDLTEDGLPFPESGYSINYVETTMTLKIPSSVKVIGDCAFQGNYTIEEVQFGENSQLTYIGDYAFSYVACYASAKLSMEIPEKVEYIGDYALGFDGSYLYETNLALRVPDTSKIQLGAEDDDDYWGIFADTWPYFRLTIGKEVDVISEDFRDEFYGALEDVYFEGPNTVQLPDWPELSDVERFKNVIFEAGTYHIDEFGAIYRLNDDATAKLIRVPNTLAGSYTVPKTITSDTGAKYSVISVAAYSFFQNDVITSVTFEAPEQMVSIEDFSFSYLPKLTSVNGETELSTVLATFTNPDVEIDAETFYLTGLTNSDYSEGQQVSGKTTQTENGINVSINTIKRSTAVGTLPQMNGDTYQYYTGETATFSVTMENLSNVQVTDKFIRLYMQFDDDDGELRNYKLGKIYIETQDASGNEYETSLNRAGETGLYYWDFPIMQPGDALDIDIQLRYPSPNSDGGNAKIWANILDENYKNVLSPAKTYHLLNWSTQPDDYTLEKTYVEDSIKLVADEEKNVMYVSGMKFKIQLTRKKDTALSVGKTVVSKRQYVDIIELPDNVKWRDEVIDALSDPAGCEFTYESYSGSEYDYNVYITYSDGVESEQILLCRFKGISPQYGNDFSAEVVNVEGKDTVALSLTECNPGTDGAFSIGFGDKILEAEEIVEEDTLIFTNNISAKQFFKHSQVVTHEASADAEFYCDAANLEMDLQSSYYSAWYSAEQAVDISMKFGGKHWYKIVLTNTGVSPVENLSRVEDVLDKHYFITADDLQAMFEEDEKQRLNITITNAAVGAKVNDDDKNVITVNGINSTITSSQYVGNNTTYNSLETSDDCIGEVKGATLTLKWENGELKLTVNKNNGDGVAEYTIGTDGDYPDIPAALGGVEVKEGLYGVGLVIGPETQYEVRWDFEDDFRLFAGQTVDLIIRSNIKSSFMLQEKDVSTASFNYYNSPVLLNNGAVAYEKSGDSLVEIAEYTPESFGYLYDGSYDWSIKTYIYDKENDKNISNNESVAIGDVLEYQTDLYHTHRSSGSYLTDTIPMVQQIEGAQVLMLPIANNESNAKLVAASTLRTIEGYGEQYLLNTPGTYENVYIQDNMWADKVVVESVEGGGLRTRIHWYIEGAVTQRRIYANSRFVIAPDLAGYGSEVLSYETKGEAWLNDHETQRLHRPYTSLSTIEIGFDKFITAVKNEETNKNEENLSLSRSIVSEGDSVTYTLRLSTISKDDGILSGDNVFDELPLSLDSYWTKNGTVEVSYRRSNGEVVPGGDEWYLEDVQGTNQQQLRWNEDYKFNLSKEPLYIDVTLTFPKGEAWQNYLDKYGSVELKNTSNVLGISVKATNLLQEDTQGFLQKGVYSIGIGDRWNSNSSKYADYLELTEFTGRGSYVNDTVDPGLVCYYVNVVNTGKTRLYLEDMQDLLPEGFSFIMVLQNANYNYAYIPTVPETTEVYCSGGEQYVSTPGITYKAMYVTPSLETVGGKQKVTFSFSGYQNTNKDELLEKAFLNPNEGLQFAYFVRTNVYDKEIDNVATNEITMPFYAYSGGDFVLDTNVQSTLNDSVVNPDDRNDGEAEKLTAAVVASDKKWITSDAETTQWLYSEVDVVRKDYIKPGVAKTVKDVKNMNGENTGITLGASSLDAIGWLVTVANEGTATMIDYTVTDVLQKPYSFASGYNITFNVYGIDGEKRNTFNIGKLTKNADGTYELKGVKREESEGKNLSFTNKNITNTLTLGQPLKIAYASVYRYSAADNDYVKKDEFIEVTISIDENGNEVLSLHFIDATFAVPAGGKVELEIWSKKPDSSSLINKIYSNLAYLTPVQTFRNPTDVAYGKYTEYQEKPSLMSTSHIMVSYGSFTGSNISVNEVGNSDNTASATDVTNFITLPTEDNKVRYTLSVTNATSAAIDNLTLLCNLPEPGDVTTYGEERGSEYKVDLVDFAEQDIQVMITHRDGETGAVLNEYILDPDNYVVRYSAETPKTLADNMDKCWLGDEGWSDKSDRDTRTIRIMIENAEAFIPENATVSVSFNAKVAEDQPSIAHGATAWNSFGYRYSLVEDDRVLESSPFTVGVKTPFVPTIAKEVKNSAGRDYIVENEKGESFRFVVYTGTEIPLSDNFTDAELAQALTANSREFTYVEVTVPYGKSVSDDMVLQNCMKSSYNYAQGTWDNGTNIWTWENYADYTIVELPDIDKDFHFSSIAENRKNPSYTFKYNYDEGMIFEVVNIHEDWSIEIEKIDDAPMNPITLAGAVFGLYSPLESDKMTDEEYAQLVGEIEKDVVRTISSNGETYYLSKSGMTKTGGKLYFDSLSLTNDKYIVAELVAPSGYIMKEDAIAVEQSNVADGFVKIEVVNKAGFELPQTGGIGTTPYIIVGLLIMGIAAYFIYKQAKRRKEGMTSISK